MRKNIVAVGKKEKQISGKIGDNPVKRSLLNQGPIKGRFENIDLLNSTIPWAHHFLLRKSQDFEAPLQCTMAYACKEGTTFTKCARKGRIP